MSTRIITVPVTHNGLCFHTGAKVTGRIKGVALIEVDGVIKTAMPVSKEYMEALTQPK